LHTDRLRLRYTFTISDYGFCDNVRRRRVPSGVAEPGVVYVLVTKMARAGIEPATPRFSGIRPYIAKTLQIEDF
jgi:hypothetical protein